MDRETKQKLETEIASYLVNSPFLVVGLFREKEIAEQLVEIIQSEFYEARLNEINHNKE